MVTHALPWRRQMVQDRWGYTSLDKSLEGKEQEEFESHDDSRTPSWGLGVHSSYYLYMTQTRPHQPLLITIVHGIHHT